MQTLFAIFIVLAPVLLLIFLVRQLIRFWREAPLNISKNLKTKRIFNVLTLSSLILWPLAIFGVGFMFDAPGSDNFINYGLASSIVFYPISVLAGYKGFREGWEVQDISKMNSSTWIVLIGPITLVFFLLLMSGICGGKLAC